MRNSNRAGTFAKYVAMNVLGMLGLSCYILADTYFISKRLGAAGLTALNLAIPIYSFIHGSGLMLGMGGATRYAIHRSQQKQRESDRVFTNTVWLGVIAAAIFLTAGIFLTEKITGLIGADRQVFELTRTYLKVILLFSPFFILNEILLCFVRNDGKPQLAMTAMLAGSFSNIVLDYIFLFPCDMGIFGAVFATGLAPIISILVMAPYLLRGKRQFHLILMRPQYRIGKDTIAIGLPSFITELSSGIVIMIFNAIILGIAGNTGVAAYGVIANLSLVAAAVYTGIAQGIQPMISAGYGKGEKEEIHAVFRYAVLTALVVSVLLYLVIFFQAEAITRIFNSEGNALLADMAERGLKIYFTACVPLGLNIITAVYFSCTGHTVSAQLISILRGFILVIPLAVLLSVFFELTGVWLTVPFSEALTLLAALVCYVRAEKKSTVSGKSEF